MTSYLSGNKKRKTDNSITIHSEFTHSSLPQHVAIIMDGNGRWAKKRLLPRVAGHVAGVGRVKEITKHCAKIGIPYLTLFAFGRDNWQRPADEVSCLMQLLYKELDNQLSDLHENNVKVNFIGDRNRLNAPLLKRMENLEALTLHNTGLNLSLALDYSGTYDITQAVNRLIKNNTPVNNTTTTTNVHAVTEVNHIITEAEFSKYLLFYPRPDPDLLIRTSGEMRLSNFMLWQAAYSECYFIDTLWPDFTSHAFDKALNWYRLRERRFGKTTEQLLMPDNNM